MPGVRKIIALKWRPATLNAVPLPGFNARHHVSSHPNCLLVELNCAGENVNDYHPPKGDAYKRMQCSVVSKGCIGVGYRVRAYALPPHQGPRNKHLVSIQDILAPHPAANAFTSGCSCTPHSPAYCAKSCSEQVIC